MCAGNKCQTCRRIGERIHPDVVDANTEVTRLFDAMPKEQKNHVKALRQFISKCYTKPNDGDVRIIIFGQLDDMQVFSQYKADDGKLHEEERDKLKRWHDGLINIVYKQMSGNKDAVIPFLSQPSWWVGTYIGLGIWKEAGWGTIIYLAALTSISPELYEAAAVDGAGRFRRIWHVTLPGLRPTIIVLLIMRLGYILGSEFDRPLALSNKLVTDVSTVISIYVYQKGINGGGQFSLTTAVGLFQSVVGVLFLFGANFLAKRFGERGIM